METLHRSALPPPPEGQRAKDWRPSYTPEDREAAHPMMGAHTQDVSRHGTESAR